MSESSSSRRCATWHRPSEQWQVACHRSRSRAVPLCVREIERWCNTGLRPNCYEILPASRNSESPSRRFNPADPTAHRLVKITFPSEIKKTVAASHCTDRRSHSPSIDVGPRRLSLFKREQQIVDGHDSREASETTGDETDRVIGANRSSLLKGRLVLAPNLQNQKGFERSVNDESTVV